MEDHLYRRLVPQKELLGIEQIHQGPILFNYSVLLPRLLCSLLSTSRSRGEVVNRLVLLPSTELLSDLYAVLRFCHGGKLEQEQKDQE